MKKSLKPRRNIGFMLLKMQDSFADAVFLHLISFIKLFYVPIWFKKYHSIK